MRNTCNISVKNPEGKRPLRRPRHRREDYIETNFKEIENQVVNWINVAQDREQWHFLTNTKLNIRIP
jgi:hypothetical protein